MKEGKCHSCEFFDTDNPTCDACIRGENYKAKDEETVQETESENKEGDNDEEVSGGV